MRDTTFPAPEDTGRAASGDGAPRRPPLGAMIRLLLGAAAAWLLFVVLHHLLSGRFWLWLLPDLVPPLVYLAVPLLLLAGTPLAGRARRWYAALTVASLVLGAGQSGLNPGGAVRGDRPVPAGALRVLSWNTEYWHQHDDPGRFYAFLRSHDADVYALQEYLNWTGDTPLRVDDLARLRREFPGYHLAVDGELVTLSRFPVTATARVGPARALGPAAPWRATFDLAKVLRTDLRIGASVLSVYNVHIPTQYMLDENPLTPEFHVALRARDAARGAQFRGLRADLDANRNPVVVTGDFNTTYAMGDLRKLPERLAGANGASSRLLPASWPAGGPALWQLDWTFTSQVTVHRYGLLDPRGMSDHRAQSVLLSVATNRPLRIPSGLYGSRAFG
ncbi:endonuclease/exonuclease/phosphatase family protein [Streptosporangium sp. NPDC023615]|uniref:endonuclease/exonuclease/phosphatase family protein n=1 Tax=Streptosporangium sp. NPDC023615 TaxID=3154794 RepID=UPI0034348B44